MGSKMRKCNTRGVSLIEILLGLLIVTIASIATLQYFAYGLGNIGKQGRRRAALERARQRLEQLMAADTNQTALQPPVGSTWWLTCSGNPCVWTRSTTPVTQTVSVNDMPAQTMETTIQGVHDASAGTGANTLDTLALGVKVWYTPGAADDDFHRVYVRTLRTP